MATCSDQENDQTEEFHTGDAGASATYPLKASGVRKGGHMMIKDHPCKVDSCTVSKPGKHGHAKIHFVGFDIFTSKKYDTIISATHNVDIPNIKKEEYQLFDLSYDNYLSLMDEKGNLREDIPLPEGEYGEKILEEQQKKDYGEIMVTVMSAVDNECIVGVKTNKSKQP